MNSDIEKWYQEYGGVILRRAEFLLKDKEKASDVMQDVFVKLLNYQKEIRKETAFSFIYRITTNVCLNIIRDRKRQLVNVHDDLLSRIASSEDIEDKVSIKDYLSWIFRAEKPSTKVIVIMHMVDRMTLSEIAKEVGLSVSGVRKRIRLLKVRTAKLKSNNNVGIYSGKTI